jgi:hypothetical protein
MFHATPEAGGDKVTVMRSGGAHGADTWYTGLYLDPVGHTNLSRIII